MLLSSQLADLSLHTVCGPHISDGFPFLWAVTFMYSHALLPQAAYTACVTACEWSEFIFAESCGKDFTLPTPQCLNSTHAAQQYLPQTWDPYVCRCCLICIYMPAIDRSLSYIVYTCRRLIDLSPALYIHAGD